MCSIRRALIPFWIHQLYATHTHTIRLQNHFDSRMVFSVCLSLSRSLARFHLNLSKALKSKLKFKLNEMNQSRNLKDSFFCPRLFLFDETAINCQQSASERQRQRHRERENWNKEQKESFHNKLRDWMLGRTINNKFRGIQQSYMRRIERKKKGFGKMRIIAINWIYDTFFLFVVVDVVFVLFIAKFAHETKFSRSAPPCMNLNWYSSFFSLNFRSACDKCCPIKTVSTW